MEHGLALGVFFSKGWGRLGLSGMRMILTCTCEWLAYATGSHC